ncbi:Retrovirus-related Pol polyprotein from type-1 retrotransposable element R1 [Lucilia cuprina]|nr:Retrovirus-related Pol polyprotein from type-1 retrotransposable element R1 [Lucilia cuprina]
MLIDSKLSFKSHIKYIEAKARKSATSLCRIMPYTRGPKYHRRKILAGVVKSIMQFKTYSNKLNSVYRLTALRVCSAYRTVSDEAAFVIAGLIPVDLLAAEIGSIHMDNITKIGARSKTLESWQRRWSATTKGRWTYTLIPNPNKWLGRKHGHVEYHTTQFFSGHGAYIHYLHRFGLTESPLFPICHDLEVFYAKVFCVKIPFRKI